MPKGICPKCEVRPVLPKRSYCRECGNEWQKLYKREHPQLRTEEQRERQRFMARQRIANMTPEARKAYYDRKNTYRVAWFIRKPEVRLRRNAEATVVRGKWSKERREQQSQSRKKHYDELQLRIGQNLCAHSAKCNEPPAGDQKFCTLHWCRRIWFAHSSRVKPTYTIKDLVALWHKQEGKCAILGCQLVPGGSAALDHIVPMERGGDGSIGNVRFIHEAVNRMKWAMTDEELKSFLTQHGSQLLAWAVAP